MEANWSLVAVVVFVALLALGSALFLLRKKAAGRASKRLAQALPPAEVLQQAPAPEPAVTPKAASLSDRLAPTRGNLLQRLGGILGRGALQSWTSREWEEMEEALLEGDVGVGTTTILMERLRNQARRAEAGEIKALLKEEAEKLLGDLSHGPHTNSTHKPLVISIVGVNGAGKTTTVGKLAERFRKEGKSVLLGAADTFRAAAISQLRVWAERSGAQFVTGREGADPGAVAFDSVTAAKARNIDVVLLDTAGRLHTKTNLMDELKKVHRVIKKVIPDAPHETWLIVDGTTGQNAVNQAREFQRTLELTGVIVTKLDGTAKGGALLSIAAELRLPVKFIGVGESAEDLVPFVPKTFIEAILA